MFCPENITFYLAAQRYRHQFRSFSREQAWAEATQIYREFVAVNAHNEVRVESAARLFVRVFGEF